MRLKVKHAGKNTCPHYKEKEAKSQMAQQLDNEDFIRFIRMEEKLNMIKIILEVPENKKYVSTDLIKKIIGEGDGDE